MEKRTYGTRVYFLRISLFVALTVLLSWVSLPFTPPLTLGLFAITLSLYLLGGVGGIITVTVYLAMGAIGLPVFSGFVGGVGHFASATGGYLIGYLLYALTYATLCRVLGEGNKRRLVYSAAGLIILYASGSVWYAFVYLGGSDSYFASLLVTVVPFIIPDAIKIALAYLVNKRLSKIIKMGENK
ncbi:MAG: biotin transporter BioY [Clostridia bacterium]|nr:biotin transporter BioY [Clostridia bacterium]